jgi:hypothetical protein
VRKQILFICIIVLSVSSCERDDICIDDVTPNFTIRFFDSEDPDETKSISGLEVKLLDTDIDTLLFSSDSIQLPLRLDINTTKYSLTNELSESLIKTDTITLVYSPEVVFVGRACGFKSIFNNVVYSNTNNWITDVEIVSETINDENLAHVKIYH